MVYIKAAKNVVLKRVSFPINFSCILCASKQMLVCWLLNYDSEHGELYTFLASACCDCEEVNMLTFAFSQLNKLGTVSQSH